MTITPEKLRQLAAIEAADQLGKTENADALREAADEIERLQQPRRTMTRPHDDCECVVCETMRNPPPPTEALKQLVRKAKAAGHKDLRK